MAVTKSKLILIGFASEPVLRTKADGKRVCQITVRTFHKKKGDSSSDFETEWHNVYLFDQQAEIGSRVKKGDLIYVEGTLRTETYPSKKEDGQNRVAIKIFASSIDNLADARKGSATSNELPSNQADSNQADSDQANEDEIPL